MAVRQLRRTVAAVGVVLLLAAACSDDGDPQASPGPRGTLTASPIDDPSAGPDLPSPGPTASATPSPTASPTERVPTDTDRARFVRNHAPEGASDLEHVAADVDGDDVDELVFVYVRSGARVSHVEVAWWNAEDEAYAIEWSDDGGPAERIDRLRVTDVNADGRTELVVDQSVGSSGASMTLWRAGDRRFEPLAAVGGCHDGSNTYGVVGAELRNEDGDPALEIVASCDDSPLPPAAWNSDVYDWGGSSYTYSGTRLPNE